MRELLLAYLFGQLDLDQREQVERALADEPELREELRQLRECLGADAVDPPPGLVERTCRRVGGLGRSRPGAVVCTETVAMGAITSPADAWHGERRCSRGDMTVALGLTMVAALFLFPALHDSRVLARRAGCQNNMRELYQGLSLYANTYGGSMPHVPAEGPESFAGIFTVRLGEGQFIDRRELGQFLVCPATLQVGDWEREAFLLRFRIPTREELLASPDEALQSLKRGLAGSYAYRLGYVDGAGRYRAWRNDRSPRSAVLADAPSLHREGFQSSNHGGHGQNVLFADGHVAYVCNCAALECGDHLFKNRAGYRAAALGRQDNVLVRSEDGPGLKLMRSLWQQ